MPRPASKDSDRRRLACYCFEIPAEEVTRESIAFVRGKVAAGECACREMNPSGKCCLPTLGRLAGADGSGPA